MFPATDDPLLFDIKIIMDGYFGFRASIWSYFETGGLTVRYSGFGVTGIFSQAASYAF